MIDSTEVRLAEAKDLPALCDLLAELFEIETDFVPDRKNQEKGLRLLLENKERNIILTAWHNETLAGMVTGQTVVSTAAGSLSILLEDLVVRKGFRRKQIGTHLIRSLEEWGHAKGACRIQLSADERNETALKFYLKYGYSGSFMRGFYKRIIPNNE